MLVNWHFSALIIATLVVIIYQPIPVALDELKDDIGKSVAELIRSREFVAEEHYVTTSDGYILQLNRLLNPLINEGKSGLSNKAPLILIHGAVSDGRRFVINSANARPRDFSNRSVDEIVDQLRDDPLTKSVAFLASSFGHEVWIINRRGTSGSRGYVKSAKKGEESNRSETKSFINLSLIGDVGDNLLQREMINDFTTSFNLAYWNFSLDEQTKYDFPAVVDYVINKTSSRKASIIAHSAGGAITLMALSSMPDIQDKLERILLWAPGLYVSKSEFEMMSSLLVKVNYNGPILPPALITLSESIAGLACQSDALCSLLDYLQSGGSNNSSSQDSNRFDLTSSGPSSAHELLQLSQSAEKGKMYTYDYKDSQRNLIAYGQEDPVLYDASKINFTELTIWYGNNDQTIQAERVMSLLNDLRVPYKERFFNDSGLEFQHESYFLHKNVSELVVIPAMKLIASE